MKTLLSLAFVLVATTASPASDKAALVAQFNGYIETCTADPGDEGVDACITNQVDSVDNYLGDIVGEMTQYVSKPAATLMLKGHKAFETHRHFTCSYEQEAHPEDPHAGLFCFLRLTEQRVSDVREGLDFALRTPAP